MKLCIETIFCLLFLFGLAEPKTLDGLSQRMLANTFTFASDKGMAAQAISKRFKNLPFLGIPQSQRMAYANAVRLPIDQDKLDEALKNEAVDGNDKVVELLLEKGANVHRGNDWPLQIAAKKGHDKVVKVLLEYRADVHIMDDLPLQYAACNGHDKVVQVLLSCM